MKRARARPRAVAARAVAARAVALALWLAAAACTPAAPLGGRCVFNDECALPNVCAGGYCRAPCRTDADCVNDWECRSSGQFEVLVCMPPDAPLLCVYDHDCERDRGLCGGDHRCHPQCRTQADCSAHSGALTCDTALGICNWPAGDAGP